MAAILRMIVVLSTICALSGFALSYLRISTAKRIEEQVLTFVQRPAILQIFGAIDNDPIADRKRFPLPGGGEVIVFPAKREGKLQGLALEAFHRGYGDEVGVMVGIVPSGEKLLGIGITTMRETPGLGTLIAQPKFTRQFISSPVEVALKANGGSIDAVSGATISSTAAVESVRKAVAMFKDIQSEAQSSWAN